MSKWKFLSRFEAAGSQNDLDKVLAIRPAKEPFANVHEKGEEFQKRDDDRFHDE